MTYRGPWNAASVRHRQTPRRYKRVAPVGDHELNVQGHGLPEGTYRYLENGKRVSITLRDDRPTWPGVEPEVCPGCKVHVCSCEKPSKLFGGLSAEKCQRAFEQMDALQADMPSEPPTSVEYIRADGTARVHIGKRVFVRAEGAILELIGGGPEWMVANHEERKQVMALIAKAEAAHRASMQPQGGTAADRCNHSGIGLLGCEVCDPLAKVRQASERASGRSK